MSDWKLFLLSPDGNPNQELGFQCTVCGNSYKLFSSLKRHMKKHDSEPQHVCPVCYKTFYNKWEMTRHLNRTHFNASNVDPLALLASKLWISPCKFPTVKCPEKLFIALISGHVVEYLHMWILNLSNAWKDVFYSFVTSVFLTVRVLKTVVLEQITVHNPDLQ